MTIKGKAYHFVIGFLFFIIHNASGQDKKVADSLTKIYHQNTVKDTARLELLRNLAFHEQNDFKLALQYAEELINAAGNNSRDGIKVDIDGRIGQGRRKNLEEFGLLVNVEGQP